MKNSVSVIIRGPGDDCPRCGMPTVIKEHDALTIEIMQQKVYYSRWFVCENPHCKTTLIMPKRYMVHVPPEIKEKIKLETRIKVLKFELESAERRLNKLKGIKS